LSHTVANYCQLTPLNTKNILKHFETLSSYRAVNTLYISSESMSLNAV